LHKIHTSEKPQKKEDDESEEEPQQEELTMGQKLESVKIKEINFFDGMPIVSIRQSLLTTDALNYKTI
jgi:hypothetical protein